MTEIKLSDWIKSIDKDLESDTMSIVNSDTFLQGLPIFRRTLISIKEQTIKLVKERGYAFYLIGTIIIDDTAEIRDEKINKILNK